MATATYSKADVNCRGGYNYPEYYSGTPCVNVKSYRFPNSDDVARHFGCDIADAERAAEYSWETQCESFWEYWQDTTGSVENGLHGSPEYAYFPEHTVKVEPGGRSSGWLCVTGLPPLEEWDAVMLGRWRKFEKDVLEDVKYRCSEEAVFELIECNDWHKPLPQCPTCGKVL